MLSKTVEVPPDREGRHCRGHYDHGQDFLGQSINVALPRSAILAQVLEFGVCISILSVHPCISDIVAGCCTFKMDVRADAC